MKHNWEYKRLGEVCKIYQPQTISTKLLVENGEFDVFGANGIIGKYDKYNHEFPEILLTCRGATCGTINVSNPKSWINGNAMVIHPQIELLSFNYLKYCLSILDYTSIITGAAQPQITRQSLSPALIPVPPMEVQERIVAELDVINEGIAELREQVKDLDSLAKTLFYETFGDPISNPKGWPVKKLIEMAPIQPSTLQPPAVNNKYWLLNLDQIESNTGRIIEIQYFGIDEIGNSTTTFDSNNVLYSKLRPYLNKVVIPNHIGFCSSELLTFRPLKDILNREYLAFSLRTNEFVNFINEKTGGAKMPRVKMDFLRNLKFPIPPLSLQQQFAAQIEEIEAMKRELEAQIAEAQTLLDSRMDYWFN